jgi:Ca2+-binding EF-hand superfamily protein
MEITMTHKTLLVGGLAALTLAAAGGAAFAQQSPTHGMRADSDGDRRISRTEFVNRQVERLTAMDTNRDGQVTVEERRAAMQARMAARADARFDRLDANNDGVISRAEFEAAREAGREARADRGVRPMRAGRGPARGQRGMARMDARGPIVIAEAQARAEQTFARLDTDNDGFVTAAEFRAGRQAMREQRRERMTERRAARTAQRQASPQAPASE